MKISAKSNEPTKTKKAMKTKKNFLSMAALALVGAVMTGCSSDDSIIDNLQQPENKSKVEVLSTTVGFDGGASTRALADGGTSGLIKTFAAGETLALIYTNTSGEKKKATSTLPAGSYGNTATFTFTLEDPDKTKQVQYVYPANMVIGTHVLAYNKLENQDGKLATIASDLDLATYKGDWDGASLPSATLVNQLAILKLQLKTYGANNTYDFNSVTIKDGDLSYSINRAGGYGFGQSEIYVAIEPTNVALEITANHVMEGGYEKTVTSRTYEAGKIYALALNMVQQGSSSSGGNTVTWDFSQLSGYPGIPYENGGVTLSGEAFLDFEDNMLGCSGECTFTAPEGKKFTSIVVTASEWFEFYGTGWSGSTWSDSDGQTTINFSGGAGGISTIVFTLADVD
jgi:hypothetical protein